MNGPSSREILEAKIDLNGPFWSPDRRYGTTDSELPLLMTFTLRRTLQPHHTFCLTHFPNYNFFGVKKHSIHNASIPWSCREGNRKI